MTLRYFKLLLFLPIFSLTWIDGCLINGSRERELENLLIQVKTFEKLKENERERERVSERK